MQPALATAFLLIAAPALSAEPGTPVNTYCGPEVSGRAICRAGEVSRCLFSPPAGLSRATGWQWRPDLLRSCAEAVPATLEDDRTGLPPGFVYAPPLPRGLGPPVASPRP